MREPYRVLGGRFLCTSMVVLTHAVLYGCASQPAYVILTIEDPEGLAVAARVVAVGSSLDSLEVTRPAKIAFPLTITITAKRAGRKTLWVELRGGDGQAVLGRGRTEATFVRQGTETANARLWRPCVTQEDCFGATFCGGGSSCSSEMCGEPVNPCPPSPFACVQVQCIEAARACAVLVDHDQCPPLDLGEGVIEARYCDLAIGCARGRPCQVIADCQDASVCNGEEQCIAGRCVAGAPVAVDDGNSCNIDACLEPTGEAHFPDPVMNGRSCSSAALPAGQGICLAGACAESTCGDGYVDPRMEQCEDGNDNPNDGCDSCRFTTWQISIISGLGKSGGDPLKMALKYPDGLAIDRLGNLYVVDEVDQRVLRLDVDHQHMSFVAGNGRPGYSGDGRAGSSAQLYYPRGIAIDGIGNAYISDSYNHRVRKVAPDGTISTVAGTGVEGTGGDGGPAVAAELRYPYGIDADSSGNVIVADYVNCRIRWIDSRGMIRTAAGNGTAGFAGDNGPAVAAKLYYPMDAKFDGKGGFFVVDYGNSRVRHVDKAGIIATVAGTGTAGYSGDGGLATDARLNYPNAVTVGETGEIFIADSSNSCVRKIDAEGVINTIAGTGVTGFSGDGGLGINAELNWPSGIALDPAGNVYISDSNNFRIRRLGPDGIITTIVGSSLQSLGDGGSADRAELLWPDGMVVDPLTNSVYVVDAGHYRLRRINSQGIVTTVAGTGRYGYDGDGGLATAASFQYPEGVAVDGQGNLYISDWTANVIRKVDADGIITTYAGTGTWGFAGDGGPAVAAELNGLWYMTAASDGTLYVPDYNNHVVRRVAPDGVITTIAGTPQTAGFAGDGGPALNAKLNRPSSAALDSTGRLIIADYSNHRIRRLETDGTITTVAGTGTAGMAGEAGPATSAQLNYPVGVVVDGSDNIYVTDSNNNRALRIDPAGILTRVAGTGTAGFSGDYGPATSAQLDWPTGIATTATGELLIEDYDNNRVRRIDSSGIITTFVGMAEAEGNGSLSTSRLGAPTALSVGTDGPASGLWYIADGGNGYIRALDRNGDALSTLAGYPGGLSGLLDIAVHARLFDDAAGLAVNSRDHQLYGTERDGHTLRRIDLLADPPMISIYAGAHGSPGFVDGALAEARFANPSGLLLDSVTQTLYLADSGNHVIRAIALESGTVTTIAGTPQQFGFHGEGILATEALLQDPEALALGIDGDLYVADTGNNRVRRIDNSSTIHTILGDGTPASGGMGSPARLFTVDNPRGLAVDRFGNLFVTSRTSVRVVTAGADGIATGEDAVSTIYGLPPRGQFPESVTQCLTGVALYDDPTRPAGNLLLTDACQGFLLELRRQQR
jgi:cysteine-rich repeat protein